MNLLEAVRAAIGTSREVWVLKTGDPLMLDSEARFSKEEFSEVDQNNLIFFGDGHYLQEDRDMAYHQFSFDDWLMNVAEEIEQLEQSEREAA
jgi:hypothetical protein